MADLIVVKHAAPEIVEDLPPSQWALSEFGRGQCHELSERLAQYLPASLFASQEPKAVETAEMISPRLGLSPALVSGLHENDRTALPFLSTEVDFHARMRDFFIRSGDRVVGNESADEAHARFVGTLKRLLSSEETRPTVVVTHGTVATLLVARANHLSPYYFWRDFDFASFVVLSTPSFILREVVHIASS